MPFTIIRNDITKMKVDAIVNAANTALKMGSGVCGAIFRVAGEAKLQAACNKLAPVKTGEAVITPGFKLPAKYIIHTAGPIYKDGNHWEAELLRNCYINSLKRAVENNCQSIAFPLISSGIYGYPKAEALHVATSAIQAFLEHNDIDVYLVVFDKEAFEISEELLGEIEAYIDENYLGDYHDSQSRGNALRYKIDTCQMAESVTEPSIIDEMMSGGIEDLVGNLDESFSQTLLRLIDAKGLNDVDVYKRANLDRKLFSKIRSNKSYMPSKVTAVALAVALELSISETNDLLKRAGFALSQSKKFDVIVEYFIVNGKYDIFTINEVLFKYDQQLLGG